MQLLCEECEELQSFPHAAGTVVRFQTRGIGEKPRVNEPPVTFKFWMCVLCCSLWTEEVDPTKDPVCTWICTGVEPDSSLP